MKTIVKFECSKGEIELERYAHEIELRIHSYLGQDSSSIVLSEEDWDDLCNFFICPQVSEDFSPHATEDSSVGEDKREANTAVPGKPNLPAYYCYNCGECLNVGATECHICGAPPK